VQNGDEAETGTLDGRTIIEQESEEN
jgi:hypothetical protein